MAFTRRRRLSPRERAAPFLIEYGRVGTLLMRWHCWTERIDASLSFCLLLQSPFRLRSSSSYHRSHVHIQHRRHHPPLVTAGEDSIIVMAKPTASGIPRWYQHEISVTAPNRGCHLITHQITAAIKSDITSINIGMVNIFIQHTSASLTINENTDPDVLRDMEVALNKLVPGTWTADGTFHHTAEGEDDMPGHVKSSLMGTSLNIPIRNGHMALGTWQGIYLNEHRNQGGWGGGHTRKIIITLQGQS